MLITLFTYIYISSKGWLLARTGAITRAQEGGVQVAPPILGPGGKRPQTQKQDVGFKKTRWRIQKQDGGFKVSILPALHALLASTLLLLLPPRPPVLLGLHARLHFPEEGTVFCSRNKLWPKRRPEECSVYSEHSALALLVLYLHVP